MVRRTIMLTLLIGSCFTSVVFAYDQNCRDKYIVPGRAAMLEGSLSGLRDAYSSFNAGVQDTSKCTGDQRELTFLHAVTRTAILFIGNSSVTVDGNSFLGLAEGFGVDVPGDYFEFPPNIFESLGINVPLDPNGCYKIPPEAPDANKISDVIHNSIIPEINDIIAELDSISDPAGNRFRIFFHPDETGLENDLIVDYGEVLILKGSLLAFKSQLEAKLAYDVFVNVNGTLLHKLLYENGVNPEEPDFAELAAIIGIVDPNNISINNDFLNPYPNLLKVLPTTGHPEDGAAILAKSKKDLLASIENYFNAVNYIWTNSPQNALVYIDPNDKFGLDTLNQKLTALQKSLKDKTAATYPLETTKTYNVYDSNSILIGQMVLVYDLTDLGGNANSLTFTKPGVPTPWEVDWFGIAGGTDLHKNAEFEADLEYYSSGYWREGYLEGTYNSNGNITDVTFEYWGDDYGTLEGLRCILDGTKTKVTNITFNLNPIFGPSPPPVNPRYLLPQFDANNQPLAGTFGHGLGNDATLGGILPGKTQQDWTNLLRLSTQLLIVPNIVSKTAAAANTAITGASLVVGTVTTAYSNTVAVGVVISQDPTAYTAVASGSPVNYVKSLGKPIIVPYIVGKAAAVANAAIVKANLVVGTVTAAYSNTVVAGLVISQDPTANTPAAIGSPVNYVKSLGKPAVPNIVGKTEAAANSAITSIDNLQVGTVTTAYSNTVAAGKVISQSPAAGAKVNIGSSVNYVKSLGKPIVPNIVGMTAANANTTITSGSLQVGTVTTAYSDTVAAGVVINQSPAAGTAVMIGSKVNYVKSLGKLIVPNIVSMTAAAANAALVKVKLVAGTVTTAYSDTVAAGKIISQNPLAGTEVAIGSPVNYVKSLGKPAVPNIVGKTEAAANSAITSVDNLQVGTVTTAYSNTVTAGKVISQNPAAGAKVNTGSSVNYAKSLGKPVVPYILGMTAADANALIISVGNNANLKVGTITTAYSNTVAAGRVISQNPVAGAAVAIGSKVNYLKSLGKPVVLDIRGKAAAAANAAITSVDNLKVGTVTLAYDNNVPAGSVISQDPNAGTVVNTGSPVNYVKSLGKPAVPNIVGKTEAAANSAITSVDNLQVGTVTTAYSNTVPIGKVISQNPAAGAKVNIGSSVNYLKSLGKRP